jgi:hypothetical protein
VQRSYEFGLPLIYKYIALFMGPNRIGILEDGPVNEVSSF